MTKNINASGQYGNSQFTVSSISGEGAYSTIQDALNDIAGSTTTIFIYPGTYNESITWPANVSIEGASHGEESFDVIINGSQTFNGSGNISFRNINFTNGAGDCWNQDSTTASGSLEFIDCKIESNSNRAIVVTSTSGISELFLRNSQLESSLQSVDASDNSILDFKNSTLSTSTNNINTIDMAGSASLNISSSNLNTSGMGTGCNVSLNGATNSVDSQNNRYNAGNAPNASAFLFTVAGGFVRSSKDEMFIAGGTFWARSAGAFGSLAYGNNIIDTGTTENIDPQITSTPLVQTPSTSIENINTDAGSATPSSRSFTVGGGTGISTSGSASTVTINLDTPVSVEEGGTGVATLTDGGILLGSATGSVTVTSQPTDGQLLVGSTGVDPVLATLTEGAGVSITNAAGSITLSSTATVWSAQASGTSFLPYEGFISTSAAAQNFPLPATAAIGEVFELAQSGTGLVTITQAAGQSIRFGNQVTTVGTGGSIASSEQGDAIKLVCTTANTTFQVVTGAIGNWIVT